MPVTTYTPETADIICVRMCEGESLRSICRDEGMPSYRTAFVWLQQHEEFLEAYKQAQAIRADAIFDDIFDIADDGRNDWMERQDGEGSAGWRENGEAIRRSALRVDARKWALARMAPKKYGERLDLNHSGGVSVTPDLDLSGLSDDELAVMRLLLDKTKGARTGRVDEVDEAE